MVLIIIFGQLFLGIIVFVSVKNKTRIQTKKCKQKISKNKTKKRKTSRKSTQILTYYVIFSITNWINSHTKRENV